MATSIGWLDPIHETDRDVAVKPLRSPRQGNRLKGWGIDPLPGSGARPEDADDALTTAYAAGLRASETVGLKVGNIDSERGVIRVEHGKGGKDRTVMLSAELLRILRVYWRLAKPQSWLFPERGTDRHIDVQVLYSACRSARAAAGIDKRVTVHTLRHSFATHLLETAPTTSSQPLHDHQHEFQAIPLAGVTPSFGRRDGPSRACGTSARPYRALAVKYGR